MVNYSDITKIETPFGLLDEDTQAKLRQHKEGWQYLTNKGWQSIEDPRFYFASTYRAIPKPIVEWRNEYSETGSNGTWFHRQEQAYSLRKNYCNHIGFIRRERLGSETTYYFETKT